MIKKAVSLLLSVAIMFAMLCSVTLSSSAVATATMQFDVKKYDSSLGSYTAVSQAKSGDTIYIVASLSQVNALGGLTFVLNYNASLFSLDKAKSFSAIQDSKSDTFFKENNGKITVTWDTLSSNTTVNGVAFYIALNVSGTVAEDADCTFPATIVEMFDGSANQNNISHAIQNTADVKIITEQVPQEFMDLVLALGTLTYNPKNIASLGTDSLAGIKAAETAYSNLSATQQVAFRDNYPALYESLSTARNRYYRLAESEAGKIIQKEIEDFKIKFADVLKLTADTVKLSDKTAVDNAYNWMQNILSPQAKIALDDATKENVKALFNKVKALATEAAGREEAKGEVKDFLNTYGNMFTNEYMESYSLTYDVEGPLVSEAMMVHDNILSAYARAMLTKEYAILVKLKELTGKYTENDAALAALLQKVADFQQSYMYVYTLNAGNVSITDQAAIEMVIAAYNRLGDEKLKEKLQPKIVQFQSLLEVIDEMKAIEGDTPIIIDDDEDIKTPADGNTAVQTVTKWLSKNLIVESGLGTPIVILLVMVGVSVCCLIGSAALSEYANNIKKRKENAFDEQ